MTIEITLTPLLIGLLFLNTVALWLVLRELMCLHSYLKLIGDMFYDLHFNHERHLK